QSAAPAAAATPFAQTGSEHAGSEHTPGPLIVPERNQALAPVKSPSVIHRELPGLVWDLDRRIQFQNELDQWQAVSRSVILVDLPPASVPEAVLLAENLPQLIW